MTRRRGFKTGDGVRFGRVGGDRGRFGGIFVGLEDRTVVSEF